jgi:hypothetical protein
MIKNTGFANCVLPNTIKLDNILVLFNSVLLFTVKLFIWLLAKLDNLPFTICPTYLGLFPPGDGLSIKPSSF